MILEGAVTNVAAFGAFVDIGVHQDGLVHISAMSKTFIKDPREVVKPGDIVKVKVLEVEVARKRIALTLRLDDEIGAKSDRVRPRASRASFRKAVDDVVSAAQAAGAGRRRAGRGPAPRRRKERSGQGGVGRAGRGFILRDASLCDALQDEVQQSRRMRSATSW